MSRVALIGSPAGLWVVRQGAARRRTQMTKTNKTKTAPPRAKTAAAAKRQSKAEKVVALLQRDGGATLEDMMKATGWQKHSVRGFMAGALKKRHGLTTVSEKTETGRVYRVATEPRA
jgi:hypothetical protein